MSGNGNRKAILILGHGRSGTSLTSHLVNSMGAYVENTRRAPDKYNEDGYWETFEMNDINDGILKSFGLQWVPSVDLPSGWQFSERLSPLKEIAKTFIKRMNENEIWCVKDPRLSLTLPFWKPLLPRDYYLIFSIRNPLSVINSVKQYEGNRLDTKELSRIWFLVNSCALRNTIGAKSFVISFEEYFDTSLTSKPQIDRIGDFLGLKATEESYRIAQPRLVRNGTTLNDLLEDGEALWEAKMLYLCLVEANHNHDFFDSLKRLFGSTNRSLSIEELERLKRRYWKLADHPYVKLGMKTKRIFKRNSLGKTETREDISEPNPAIE